MPEKILVVDDDLDSSKLIGLMLKRQGYEVIAAHAGMPALQKAYAEHPDLIILDVMMPDMDGYEVCRRLRGEPTTADIPIIMFTAKTLVDDKVAGFEAGADDYLTKPTHPAELASRIKAVLLRRQQQPSTGSLPSSVVSASSGGQAIGFLGVKGGVGTTSLAAAVGGLLAQDQETILADLRPGQGTLSIMLGFPQAQGMATLMRSAPNDIGTTVVGSQVVRHKTGLNLLLSSANPQESQLNITPEHALAILKGMSGIARFRLVDMGSGLNRTTVRLIREMNQTVLVLEPNHTCVAMAQATLKELRNIGLPPQKIALVIFNRTQSHLQLPWQQVEQLLAHEVAAIISPAPEIAFQAAEAGVPLTLFQPDSVVAGQITKMVQELIKRGG